MNSVGRMGLVMLLLVVMIWVELLVDADYEFPKNYFWIAGAGAVFFILGGLDD